MQNALMHVKINKSAILIPCMVCLKGNYNLSYDIMKGFVKMR